MRFHAVRLVARYTSLFATMAALRRASKPLHPLRIKIELRDGVRVGQFVELVHLQRHQPMRRRQHPRYCCDEVPVS